jgi:hypothetical protein
MIDNYSSNLLCVGFNIGGSLEKFFINLSSFFVRLMLTPVVLSTIEFADAVWEMTRRPSAAPSKNPA